MIKYPSRIFQVYRFVEMIWVETGRFRLLFQRILFQCKAGQADVNMQMSNTLIWVYKYLKYPHIYLCFTILIMCF